MQIITPIILEKSNGIAEITLNRPLKCNALNGELITAIATALKQILADSTMRVLIIRGAGDHFCAGGDLQWMQTVVTNGADSNYQDALSLANCLYQLHTFPLPTLALVQGRALGGGAGLLCVCDIVIADKGASFGFPEVKIGLAPSTISPYVLAAIGERLARYYFLTGALFSAEEAKQMGLVHIISKKETLLEEGRLLAGQLLKNGPDALIKTKAFPSRMTNEKITPDIGKITALHLAELRASKEAGEGLKAFLEKRLPAWSV